MKDLNDFLNTNKVELINFSCTSSSLVTEKPLTEEVKSELTNFSATSDSLSIEDVASMYNFTLIDYLREMKRTPMQVVARRVQFLLQYMRSHKVDQLVADRDLLVQYINDYLYKRVYEYLENVTSKGSPNTNLLISMGINRFLNKKRLATDLQRNLRLLARQSKKDGYFRRDLQMRVKQSYENLFLDIMKNIESKLPQDKQGILVPAR